MRAGSRTRNAADWAGLSRAQRQMGLGWATTLDNFNNGLIGPKGVGEPSVSAGVPR